MQHIYNFLVVNSGIQFNRIPNPLNLLQNEKESTTSRDDLNWCHPIFL